ncbi:MAG TPA: hypothetical protein VFU93_15460, partial [Acidimicrobiales bacterium]|nr:hypothetical protein [Acidimicrobiales bacterium]
APPTALRAERVGASVVRVWLGAAAHVEVIDGTARSVGVLDAGPHDLPVADVERVVVVADAGGGRVERAEVGPVARAHVASAGAAAIATQPPPTTPRVPSRTVPALIAACAAATVARAAVNERRRQAR